MLLSSFSVAEMQDVSPCFFFFFFQFNLWTA